MVDDNEEIEKFSQDICIINENRVKMNIHLI